MVHASILEVMIMGNLMFILIDTLVFVLLFLGLGINWIIAFFASTALTWAGFYLFYQFQSWRYPQ